MPIASGTHLGPYVVQESIGQGAMGVVYRAYHAQLERTGAVKVLQALSPDEETTARFRREAQAIAHMRHPNVLNVFDFGEHEGVPYMIVEFVEGGSLSARLKGQELTPAQALHYLRGIGSALDYAHSLGIIHRDVKPANVLLGAKDTPILADFGLAKLLQSSSIKSITGVTTGTPAYMAPEQVTGGEVGPAADRYSLAVMAFEMLSGSLPFDDAGVLEVLYAHVHREPPHPSTRNATLTSRVDAIILRGLDKNPQSRWETCEEFVSALERALLPATPEAERTVAYAPAASRVTATRPQAPPKPSHAVAGVAIAERESPASATVFAPLQEPAAAAAERKHRRRGLVWIGAVLLALLLLLGLTAAFIVGRAPRVDVAPSIVARGDFVRVTATNVPANQAGDLELHSVIHTFAFRATRDGKVDLQIEVPFDVELGDHRIDLCWNKACRASSQLRVIAGGGGLALASPTPPSSSASPSPTPGVTPGKTPSPKPTSNPTSNPTSKPSPSPSPKPSPSPSPSPSFNVTSPVSLTTRDITVTGTYWPPNTTVTITFIQGVLTTPIGSQNVASNGSFSWKGGIPSDALPGSATIQVCDGGTCRVRTITVTL